MAFAQELPTEILCAIFEHSTVHSTEFFSESAPSPSATEPQLSPPVAEADDGELSPTETNTFCVLPSCKDSFTQATSLSQVCTRWRDIAINLQSLWTRIYLGRSAFVGRDHNDANAMEMTAEFLSRSGQLSLSLDVSFTFQDPLTVHSDLQKSRYEKNIRQALLPHVQRCLSLRLVSNDIINTAVLDIFLEHNLSAPVHHSSISQLHLEQTGPTNHPMFPPDLGLIAPYLTTLYVNGTQVSVFPRWSIRKLCLNNTFISYQNHFHIFMRTSITKLVLHRVTIPGGLPYVKTRLPTDHPSSINSLVLSELRCSGPEADHQSIYTLFFVLSIYTSLRELELSGLSRDAMVGLCIMLRASGETPLDELDALRLRKVKIDTHMTSVITASFSSVSTLVLDRVDGGLNLVFDVWQTRREIWPQLTEILLDGEIVKRE